eukprot:scaffold5138_cov125-Isochrysis_galbana.AAC.9
MAPAPGGCGCMGGRIQPGGTRRWRPRPERDRGARVVQGCCVGQGGAHRQRPKDRAPQTFRWTESLRPGRRCAGARENQ